MATPTITGINPNQGPTGGRNEVEISGSNFRVPPTPPPGPTSPRPPTVRVLFGGVEARRVNVISDTLIRVEPPPYWGIADADPIPPVDVYVENLDDSGNPIPGENATLASGYTYVRPAIRPPNATESQQIFRRVVRGVLQTWKRGVYPRVGLWTDPDYDDNGRVILPKGNPPGIWLMGPDINENKVWLHQWADFGVVEVSPGVFKKYWPACPYDLIFRFLIYSDSQLELLGLSQAVMDMFERWPYLEVPSDPNDPNSQKHEFPFELLEPPSLGDIDTNRKIYLAEGRFQVVAVPFQLEEAFKTIEEITTAQATIQGDEILDIL